MWSQHHVHGIVGKKTYWTASVTKGAFNILLFLSIETLLVITKTIRETGKGT